MLFGATAASALVIGYGSLREADRLGDGSSIRVRGTEVALNGYVTVDARGTVGIVVPRAEMGQGVRTALPMLVAEEMDADWASVRVLDTPVDPVYANITLLTQGLPSAAEGGASVVAARQVLTRVGVFLGLQITGSSSSVRDAWLPMRQAGAMARAMLVEVAAARWQVRPSQVEVRDGVVRFPPDGLELGFGALASVAAQADAPSGVRLKSPDNWRLLGTSPRRTDGLEKIRGEARFGIDVRETKQLYAAVRHIPQLAGAVVRASVETARAAKGVHSVVEFKNGVAVVADNTWRAQRAVAQIDLESSAASHLALSDADVDKLLEAALDSGTADVHEVVGTWPQPKRKLTDLPEALVQHDYAVPFLAHACMEPLNCTVRVSPDRCDLWIPTQAPALTRGVAAALLGLALESVTVHTTFLGGGFGRRVDQDIVKTAVAIAAKVPGRTVQVIWSREEDMRHDVYRPAARARMRAWLDERGMPRAIHARLASDAVMRGLVSRISASAASDGPDGSSVDGVVDRPYRVPQRLVEHGDIDSGVPVGLWRSVGHSQNTFFYESFLNELAARAGHDGLVYRRALLTNRPRHLAVLEKVARASNWDSHSQPNQGRGIALVEAFGSVVAQVVEVTMPSANVISVDRVWCAIDCGFALHPDQVEAQMEGSIVFALSAALWGRVEIVGGAVQQGNFDDYQVMRMPQMPQINVEIIPSSDAPQGVGEPAVPPLAPALTEAIYQASGRRLHSLPVALAGIDVQ
jgi:isoquinoline 1-oxidoreductase subunit beta